MYVKNEFRPKLPLIFFFFFFAHSFFISLFMCKKMAVLNSSNNDASEIWLITKFKISRPSLFVFKLRQTSKKKRANITFKIIFGVFNSIFCFVELACIFFCFLQNDFKLCYHDIDFSKCKNRVCALHQVCV